MQINYELSGPLWATEVIAASASALQAAFSTTREDQRTYKERNGQ